MRRHPGPERVVPLWMSLANGEMDEAAFCAAVRETGPPHASAGLIEGERFLSEGDTAAAEERFWRPAELTPWNPAA